MNSIKPDFLASMFVLNIIFTIEIGADDFKTFSAQYTT